MLLKRTLVEFIIVAAVGVLVGIVANSARATGSLRWNKNYFKRVDVSEFAARSENLEPAKPPADTGSAKAHLDHPYKDIDLEEVKILFDDPATAAGVNLFVDARDDQAFNEGRIPGALQFNHYQPDEFIDPIMEAVAVAEKVIVYCNGGDCEDSILVCGDLVELGVPYDLIYLFAGGWEAWNGSGFPVVTGATSE